MSDDTGAAPAAEPAAAKTETTAAASPEAVVASGAEQGGAAAAPAAAPAPADAGTILSADPAATDPAEAGKPTEGGDWPADWRERLAGDDAAFLRHLKRYSSPANYAKAGYEAQGKIRAGEAKKPPAEDATPEQVAEWRKSVGIPDAPDGYDTAVGNGYVWGENDKPALEGFLAHAHANNYTQAEVQLNLAWYAGLQEQVAAAQHAQDQVHRTASIEALKKEWGHEYQTNVNAVKNLLEREFGQGTYDKWMAGRNAEGRLVGDDPGVISALARIARELNPLDHLIPSGNSNPGKAADARLGELKKMMGDSRSDYWRGPNADKLQQEYRELSAATSRLAARAA